MYVCIYIYILGLTWDRLRIARVCSWRLCRRTLQREITAASRKSKSQQQIKTEMCSSSAPAATLSGGTAGANLRGERSSKSLPSNAVGHCSSKLDD